MREFERITAQHSQLENYTIPFFTEQEPLHTYQHYIEIINEYNSHRTLRGTYSRTPREYEESVFRYGLCLQQRACGLPHCLIRLKTRILTHIFMSLRLRTLS